MNPVLVQATSPTPPTKVKMPWPLYCLLSSSVPVPRRVCEVFEGRAYSFVHSITQSLNKHMLSICYVASVLLGTGEPAESTMVWSEQQNS